LLFPKFWDRLTKKAKGSCNLFLSRKSVPQAAGSMILSYRAIGDALHVVNLLNISLYGSLLYLYGDRPGVIFDEEWLKEGFCLPHENVPFRTTHDLSGYVMVVMALIGLAVQQYLSQQRTTNTNLTNNKVDRLVFWAFMGALGHAAGHFIIANAKRRNFYPSNENESFLHDLVKGTLLEAVAKVGPGYFLFWIPLVKTYMMNAAQGRVLVALVALFFNVGAVLVPVKFGFSYTQAVLFGGMSMDQLLSLPRKEKGFEYALWPIITTIPNGIFSWIESVGCTRSILMQRHGHIVYDLYMASSYLIFYVICRLRNNNRAKTKMP
jgi:hypothetical protein